MKACAILVALLIAVFGAQVAQAASADFSTLLANPGGNLDTENITLNGIRADAFYQSGSAYVQTPGIAPVTLFVRNEAPGDLGLGVCAPGEQGSSACTDTALNPFGGGGGQINELDNLDTIEMIRLTLPVGHTWVSVSLSSLDCNGGSCTADPESGALYYSDSTGSNVDLALGNLGNLFQNFTATSNSDVDLTIPLTGAAQTAKYLFFIPQTGSDNDYLVHTAITNEERLTEVPAPGALTLMALALAGLGAARTIRRSR